MKNFYACFLLMLGFTASAQIINFPDANFKTKLLQLGYDSNSDGNIEVSEIQAVEFLDVSNSNISDLTGISYFSGLKYFSCDYNLLTSLEIDPSIVLEGLSASHNSLTSFNAAFDVLYGASLDLSYNNFTTLTIPPGHFEDDCNLSHNQLTELTFSGNTMWYLDVSYNNLSQINGSCNIYQNLNVTHNNFTALDLSNLSFGYESTLYMGFNPADVIVSAHVGNIIYTSDNTFADFGNFNAVGSCDPEMRGNLTISNCPNLESFTLKNGFNHTFYTCNEGGTIFDNNALSLHIANCPNLSFICVDEAERPYIQSSINALGLQNQVQVNSYCTFTPGGTYYTVNGMSQFDDDANGCDAGDFHIPFQKFTIANAGDTGTIISNASGNYALYVGPGAHTITPIMENPVYFSVSPPAASVDFPAQNSPLTQNFCFGATAPAYDFDVTLIPTGHAVPGFDANYKIVYRNTGNVVSNGTVSLDYDDSVIDFASASIAPATNATGNLTWSFAGLSPFETRTINVAFNLNSPVEMPPLNSGSILTYTTSVGEVGAAMPFAHNHILNQSVVNSFDPNDKTCLEGQSVDDDMIGKFVTYQIRFENTGTYPAQNVVVKDVIDALKFDISTLKPVAGSHNFFTRITGNVAEFIFENINLPFDDANNDGYVAFKIKTKPNLVLGDTFSNSASIYFDYNFPIVTNTATTSIQQLSTPDFEFSNEFVLYPNPVKNLLSIKSKNGMEVKSVSVYNMLGQLILVTTGNTETIDISRLIAGNYIVKVYSDKGMATSKVLKL